jgi:hypothetical protein
MDAQIAVRAHLFHDGFKVLRLHGVRAANTLMQLSVARFRGGDVREHFVVAEHSDAWIEYLATFIFCQ